MRVSGESTCHRDVSLYGNRTQDPSDEDNFADGSLHIVRHIDRLLQCQRNSRKTVAASSFGASFEYVSHDFVFCLGI